MGTAGGRAQRISVIKASWCTRGGDGLFTFLIVTEDQAQHTVEVCPAAVIGLVALT